MTERSHKLWRAARICLYVLIAVLILRFGSQIIAHYTELHNLELMTYTATSYLHHTVGDNRPDNVFRSGETAYFFTDTTRTKACSFQSSFRVLSETQDSDGTFHRIVWEVYPVAYTLVKPGHYWADTKIVLPELPPGEYLIDRYGVYVCDGSRIETGRMVPFTIIE